MSGLGLIPNEIIGWRIKPDYYNFTVVLVKRHGPTSKKAGQEYEEALAYCKNIASSVQFLLQHVTRIEGERLQEEIQAVEGSVASAEAMLAAMVLAQKAALTAVAELDARLTAAGLGTPKLVTKFLGGLQPTDEGQAFDS